MEKQNIGALVILFIGIIFVFAMLPAISDGVDTLTTTRSDVNTSVVLVQDVAVDIKGQELIGAAVVKNSTADVTILSNVTVAEGLSATDGGKTIQVTLGGDGYGYLGENLSGQTVFVTYTYGADGYAQEAGTRGIASLIMVLTALGLLGFVVFYAIGKAGWMK